MRDGTYAANGIPWSGPSMVVPTGAVDTLRRFNQTWAAIPLEECQRTCHLFPEHEPHNCEPPAWSCSECGYEFDEYMHQTAVFCPNCGAKVIDDD